MILDCAEVVIIYGKKLDLHSLDFHFRPGQVSYL